jgi:hypothetical protein
MHERMSITFPPSASPNSSHFHAQKVPKAHLTLKAIIFHFPFPTIKSSLLVVLMPWPN